MSLTTSKQYNEDHSFGYKLVEFYKDKRLNEINLIDQALHNKNNMKNISQKERKSNGIFNSLVYFKDQKGRKNFHRRGGFKNKSGNSKSTELMNRKERRRSKDELPQQILTRWVDKISEFR